MERLLLDHETKYFRSEEDTMQFFIKQKETDVWKNTYINELSVLPLDNNPIMLSEVADSIGIAGISDESIMEGMQDKRLALSFPLDKLTVRPLRYTAFKTLCERAGLSGSALSCYESKSRQKEMPPENKAACLNYGLECFHGSKALVLLRDEKVSAVLSGDERDYSILPVADLIATLRKGLKKNFEKVVFLDASTNHELTVVKYQIQDKELIEIFRPEFEKAEVIMTGNSYINLLFVTSDVGLSGVNIYPLVSINGKEVIIGSEVALTHKNGHTLKNFEDNVDLIFSCIHSSRDRIKDMQKVNLKHPLGCFKAIACKLGLPKADALEVATYFDAVRPPVTTAFDLYWHMWEIVNVYTDSCYNIGKPVSLFKLMSLKENISRILKMDVKQYDHPYEWN